MPGCYPGGEDHKVPARLKLKTLTVGWGGSGAIHVPRNTVVSLDRVVAPVAISVAGSFTAVNSTLGSVVLEGADVFIRNSVVSRLESRMSTVYLWGTRIGPASSVASLVLADGSTAALFGVTVDGQSAIENSTVAASALQDYCDAPVFSPTCRSAVRTSFGALSVTQRGVVKVNGGGAVVTGALSCSASAGVVGSFDSIAGENSCPTIN